MREIMLWVWAGYLFSLSILDIYKRRLPVWLLAGGGGLSVLCRIFLSEADILTGVWGALAGVVFVLISKYTRESLGYGDSILILMLGIYLGLWRTAVLLSVAFFLSAIYAIGMLWKHRFSGKIEFPFVPFLGIGYIFMILSGGV